MICTFMFVFILVFNVVISKQCSVLRTLDIKWNVDCSSMQLSKIPSALLVDPIVDLNFSNNSLTYIFDYDFNNWTDIIYLNLSYNNISIVHGHGFYGLTHLSHLNLSNNFLKYLTPNITLFVPNLKVLDLSNNIIKYLGPGSFQPVPLLEKLYLTNNIGLGDHFQQFDTLKTSLNQGLRRLDMSNTTLKEIPNYFIFGAPYLTSLYLKDNFISKIPVLPNKLKYLDLSTNNIEEIPDGCFISSPNLKVLILNGLINLKKLSAGALNGLDNLKELYFKNCHNLHKVSPEVFGHSTPHLNKFSINNCHLVTLHKHILQFIDKAEYVDFQNNPWNCDRSLSWIIKTKIDAELRKSLRCNDPDEARGMILTDFYDPVRISKFVTHWINVFIFISLFGICILSIAAMTKHLSQERPENYYQLQTFGAPQIPTRSMDELVH